MARNKGEFRVKHLFLKCLLFCMWLPQFFCLQRLIHPPKSHFVSTHWGLNQPVRWFLSPEQLCHRNNIYTAQIAICLAHSHSLPLLLFPLNSLNVWQLRWAAAALVVFHFSNCNPPPLLPLPFSCPLCCTVPPIIGGFTAQSLLPWNATSRGTIKQVVFIMEAQAVWPYKLSRALHVSGLLAQLLHCVVSQTADLYKDLSPVLHLSLLQWGWKDTL